MNNAGKGLTLILILALVFAASYLAVMPVNCTDPPAPTVKPDIPVPSVPQFTLSYADHSYIVPAENTSSTDAYTGKVTTITIPSYRVANFTIDVTIQNQPYPAVVNGNSSYMRYNIQSKGHFENDWTGGYEVVAQKNSETTVFSIPAPYEGDVDVHVSASLGYNYQYYFGLFPQTGFAHESSEYSNIQTISVKATPSPNWGLDFNLPYLNWLEIGIFTALGLIIVVLAVFLVLSRRRIKALEMKQNGV